MCSAAVLCWQRRDCGRSRQSVIGLVLAGQFLPFASGAGFMVRAGSGYIPFVPAVACSVAASSVVFFPGAISK